MSFAPEVRTGRDPKFYGNALRFATREEAEANAHDLMMRWFLVEETRVVESSDPVNYRWVDGALVAADNPQRAVSGPFFNTPADSNRE